MLSATLVGAAVGAGLALFFWSVVRLGLDHLNQGLWTSAGLAALIGLCLWLDGWILVAIVAFAVATAAILAVQSALR